MCQMQGSALVENKISLTLLLLGAASRRLKETGAWSGEMMDWGDGNKAALFYLPAWLPIWKRWLTTGDSCSESEHTSCSRLTAPLSSCLNRRAVFHWCVSAEQDMWVASLMFAGSITSASRATALVQTEIRQSLLDQFRVWTYNLIYLMGYWEICNRFFFRSLLEMF